MAINFIKNVYNNEVDDLAHAKFVRYGKGTYEKEEFIIKIAQKKIQVWGGFEYLDTLFNLLTEIVDEDISIKGFIISKQKIKDDLEAFGIEPKKITGKKYTIEETLTPTRFKDFVEKFNKYPLLLTVKSGINELKTKKSIPKPGKLVEKFVAAKFDKKLLDKIKEEFLFDFNGDFKEAKIIHTYDIKEIIVDSDLIEKDAAAARLAAKRKGILIRKKVIDGNEEVIEKEFIA